MRCLLNILLVSSVINYVDLAKILCVFPVPYHSHQLVLRVLVDALLDRGHQIVLLTPMPQTQNRDNITEIDISNVTTPIWNEEFKRIYNQNKASEDKKFRIASTAFVERVMKPAYSLNEAQFSLMEVQKLIRLDENYFDLIVAQDCTPPAMIFGGKFNAPICQASSFDILDQSVSRLGSEIHPHFFAAFQKVPQTFYEKIYFIIEFWKMGRIMEVDHKLDDVIRIHFGENAPGIKEVRSKIRLAVTPLQRIWDNNRAVTRAIIHMGPIHIKKAKPLSEDLQNYLNNSKNGVVYMSLGTMLRSSDLSQKTLEIIISVFKTLQYDVLWKWDAMENVNMPKNLRLEKWLPQADLLRHPSIKAFITHGGLHSTNEAVLAGVPLIALPFATDQPRNAQIVNEYGAGLILDIDNLNEEEFRNAVEEVVNNGTYRSNMRRLSTLVQDQQFNGLDLAVHQIEKLIEFGIDLRGPTAEVSFAEYFMLDVLIPLLSIVLIILILIYLIVKKIIRCCSSNSNEVYNKRPRNRR